MKATALALVVVLTGCGGGVSNPLQPGGRGPCTLELLASDGQPLTAPYVVTMQPDGPPAAEVQLLGSGWSGSMVEIRATMPNGLIQEAGVDALSLNEGRTGKVFNRPGLWVVEFEDDNCLRRVEVEVRPAPTPDSTPDLSNGPPPCGPLTVSNGLDALATGGGPEAVVLEEPYVATMGERTIEHEQVAAIRFFPTEPWTDPVIHLEIEPGPVDDMGLGIDGDDFNSGGWDDLIGTPGTMRFVFTGMVTNCQTVVDVRFVLDSELRAKDVEAGLTEPPEPAGPPG